MRGVRARDAKTWRVRPFEKVKMGQSAKPIDPCRLEIDTQTPLKTRYRGDSRHQTVKSG